MATEGRMDMEDKTGEKAEMGDEVMWAWINDVAAECISETNTE